MEEPNSGDFIPNPIYGDEPQTYQSTVMPEDEEQQSSVNPFHNPRTQRQLTYTNKQDINYEVNANNNEQPQQQEYEQENPPPPYSQNDPAPQAFSNQYPVTDGNQNEPEDVVAQMNQEYQQDDDVDYGVTAPKLSDAMDDDEDSVNGEGLFGNYFIRTVYIASSLLFCSMLSFGIWLSDTNGTDFSAGYGLSGFGTYTHILPHLHTTNSINR